MTSLNSFINKYFVSTAIINGAFKLSEVYNCKVKRNKGVITDMLLIEKVAIVSAHTIAGPYTFPLSIYSNLHKLELKIRNKDEKDYYDISETNNKEFIDYLFKIW